MNTRKLFNSYHILMKHFILSLFSTLLVFSYSSVFAIEAPTNLRVIDSQTTSASIDWQEVPWAIGYYHYIGTQSGIYTDGIDLIDATQYTVENLSADKTYYITVTSVDEFWVESEYAEEIVYSLGAVAPVDTWVFRVVSMEVIDINTLRAEFSNPLRQDPSTLREFILEQKSTGKEIFIGFTEVDSSNPTHVNILLDSELQESSEYEFTVLEIEDVDENAIESWIDAFLSFTTSDNLLPEIPNTPDLSSAGSDDQNEPTIEENVIISQPIPVETPSEENNGWVFNAAPTTVNQGNGGSNISNSEVDNTITIAAEQNEKLPQTGAEHWLLVLVAILLSTWVFYRLKK